VFLAAGSPSYYNLEVECEAQEGRLGVSARNLRRMKVAYRVNVSETSEVNSPGLSRMKVH